jgi:hypothetical protein
MRTSRSISSDVLTGFRSGVRPVSIATAVAAVLGMTAASAALAQDDSSTAQQVQALKQQVDELQRRLDALQGTPAPKSKPASAPQPKQTAAAASHTTERPQAQQTAVASGEAPPHVQPIALASSADYSQAGTEPGGYGAASSTGPGIQAGPLLITFGGFTELALIDRDHSEVADVGSVPFASIPFPTAENYTVSEFRESARQSRFSMLTEAAPWNGARAELYLETDFLGAAVTANSRESNSYNLRVRNFYARFMLDSGFQILAGQNWSLATLYKKGLDARQEDVPLTIDAQYVAGFNWTRNPQLRFVQKFNDAFSLGFSVESPQMVPNATNNVSCPSTAAGCAYPDNTYYEPGASGEPTQPSVSSSGLLNSTTDYSIDPAPDLILKAALDPGYGHYEVYGLQRWFRSEVGTNTDTVTGSSVGAGAILPIVGDVFGIQASGLVGKGIGRYGSAQLPDTTLEPNGTLSPIKGYQLLFGAFLKPVPSLQIYAYAGREQETADYIDQLVAGSSSPTTLYGYGIGSPLYNNSGCYMLGGKCVASPQTVEEVTGGLWWKYYSGQLGNLQLGLQFAYNQVNAFYAYKGAAPTTNVFETEVSFRYYPYQK